MILDNGHFVLFRERTESDARARLARWRQARREALADPDALVTPRLALGFVKQKKAPPAGPVPRPSRLRGRGRRPVKA
jgi:hypothetical protein